VFATNIWRNSGDIQHNRAGLAYEISHLATNNKQNNAPSQPPSKLDKELESLTIAPVLSTNCLWPQFKAVANGSACCVLLIAEAGSCRFELLLVGFAKL
jgi:hypothetical protein